MVSRSKHKRDTVSGAFRAVSQKLFSFWELSRSCIDSEISPAPLATAPNISAMMGFDVVVGARMRVSKCRVRTPC